MPFDFNGRERGSAMTWLFFFGLYCPFANRPVAKENADLAVGVAEYIIYNGIY